ncbi:MAG TPA: glycosyltransferase family 9 protein [Nitrospinota bacterium]|nr:glycosyltransferase family 9 protein [Nitrospinota bacterium]
MDQKKRDFEKIKEILIIRTGAIGDIILFLPVLRAIRKRFPDASIEVMGQRDRLSLLEDSCYVDKIVSIEDRDLFSLFVKDANPKDVLLQYLNRFDLIFSFIKEEDFSNNIKKFCKGNVISIPPFPPDEWKGHIIDYLLDSLKKYGIESSNKTPELYIGVDTKKMAEDFLKTQGINPVRDTIFAIHPGSGSKKKNWPLKKFSEVATWMREKYTAKILLILGPAEEGMDGEIFDMIKEINPVLAKNLPLKLLSGLIASCKLYIGNDSGITHISAALGIPTISLFGPTDTDIWGTKGKKVVILKGDMDSIATEEVKKGIELLVESEE